MNVSEMAALHAVSFTIPRPWSEAEFQDLLLAPGVFVCVDIDGFALGRLAGPEVELLTLAVHPNARRQGKGRKLLRDFAIHARENGAKQVFLEVAKDNLAAITLYTDCGYKEVGHRKNYYAGPTGRKITALVMNHTFYTA